MTANLKTIKTKLFIKYLEKKGLKLIRTKGDHLIYTRKDLVRPVVIQAKNKEQSMLVVRNTLRLIGVDIETFLKEIEEL